MPISPRMRRPLLLLSLAVALTLGAAATAHATRPLVGIGDQHAEMFTDPRFTKLHVQLTRLALAWDWYRSPASVAAVDQWVGAAQTAGVRPLIAFNRNWRRSGARYLPPRRLYLKSFRTFRKRYPQITDFSAWNEANHTSQPTHDHIKAAARYYQAMRGACPRCEIVAADVLDGNDMPGWIARFRHYAPKARLWGVHGYKDANNGTTYHLRRFLRQVKGRVWLTETGGIKRLKPHPGSKGNGRTETLKQQATSIRRVYKLARMSHRVRRIYFYQWRQRPRERWDSALIDARGRARPALAAVRSGLRR